MTFTIVKVVIMVALQQLVGPFVVVFSGDRCGCHVKPLISDVIDFLMDQEGGNVYWIFDDSNKPFQWSIQRPSTVNGSFSSLLSCRLSVLI